MTLSYVKAKVFGLAIYFCHNPIHQTNKDV